MADLATTVYPAAMPSQLRSMVKQWYLSNVVQGDAVTMAKMHATAAVEGVQATGVAVTMGSILGAFHALNTTGLDVNIPGTKTKFPADAVVALAGLLGGIGAASAPHGIGKSVAQMGATAAGIYGFRMTNDLVVKMRQKKIGVTQASNIIFSKAQFGAEGTGKGGWAGGSVSRIHGAPAFGGEDPIIKMARSL